jgi:SM-20-related protein
VKTTPPLSFSEQALDTIADGLNEQGYIIVPHALSSELMACLQQRVQTLAPELWQTAGIGRADELQLNTEIRSDKIHWITSEDATESAFLSSMETLRQGLNRRLFMGLFDYESHFSIYSKGTFYKKHLDALKGQSNRVLSTVLYLNNGWQPDEAGELVLYPEQGRTPIQKVLPELATMVIFLSEKFPHEVLAASRTRFSIAGWFRVNASQSGRVDPAR